MTFGNGDVLKLDILKGFQTFGSKIPVVAKCPPVSKRPGVDILIFRDSLDPGRQAVKKTEVTLTKLSLTKLTMTKINFWFQNACSSQTSWF